MDLTPYFDDGRASLYAGDALAVLSSLPSSSVDAVITDPPYSSGGMTRGDRMGSTSAKYHAGGGLPGFAGDNRDQRSWAHWCALWLGEALRVTRPGGVVVMFADWRQLPAASDAIQAGGWVWRGIVPWAKPGARPQQGRFTNACEYAIWGSAGPMPADGDCLPGWHVAAAPRDREHPAQKPIDVMRQLVRICPPGGVVLDPFAGSGTTGVAALMEGRRFCGGEISGHYLEVGRRRIAAAGDGGER
jgi:site-specific DNA-methyltransferase (adenine-specific)